MKTCTTCYSAIFRLSRVRVKDLPRLLILMYPVRCIECFRRSYVFLPVALRLKTTRKTHTPQGA